MAAELEVDAIVEGSIQRDANRVLITVQLIEAASDRHLWSTNYVRDLSDFFTVQSEVAQAIAAEIRVHLTPQDQRRLAGARRIVPEAVEAYLQGRHQWNRRAPEALRKAIELFQKSIQLDPRFALGHAGLADAYCIAPVTIDLPSEDSYDKARAAALRALELDDQLAEPHVSLGFLLANVDWKWREAETHFLQAIALDPAYPPAHYWYAYQLLVKQGRTNEALVQAQVALKLDPAASTTRQNYAMVLIAAGRHEEAISRVLAGPW
jgi:tetratricopeptide (TPR) repeat protein